MIAEPTIMGIERMTKSVDEEMTTPEAASFLNVTPPHIRLLYYRGVLRGEKRGRDLWITKESLVEYKKNRRPVGRPEGAVSPEPSQNKRGEREREYQREYKRQMRKSQKSGSKKGQVVSKVSKKTRGGNNG
jgi:excisionase family DNA binding protein